MNRKISDMSFLMLCLSVFIDHTDEQIKKGFDDIEERMKSPESINTGLGQLYFSLTPGLFENFITGYHNAIDKYGLSEGNSRIKERLIQIILKNRPHMTREQLLELITKVERDSKRECLFNLMREGVHFRKDENGNYTMEE